MNGSRERDALPKGRVMVVDDETVALKNLRRILEKEGYEVSAFSRPLRALKRLKERSCDVIVSDVKMPDLDGLRLLDRAKGVAPDVEVILVTGYASLDGAVEATKQGAFHYLAKPFTPDRLREEVEKALSRKRSREAAEHRSGEAGSLPVLIGESPGMTRMAELVRQIAPTDCNVLITGESGTGKELVARSLHARSLRSKGPFVAFNCGAFGEELIANELFGHEKEAFTGAVGRKPGRLETANGGTLLLDEVGDMPPSMQLGLLRVLQEREVVRVGGTRPVALDIRVVAATARDLKAALRDGAFRQDLYFRLNVVNIHLPRLSERREDIPLLAYHFLSKLRGRVKKDVRGISPEALEILRGYAYPGNVRELENIVERAMVMCRGRTLQPRDLPGDLSSLELYSHRRPREALLNLDELERDYIRHVLRLAGGVRTEAARILGIDRASLWRKMKRHGLE